MNPLAKIEKWFCSQTEEIQLEIADLAGHFQSDNISSAKSNKDKRIKEFLDYIDSSELEDKEIVKRTLWITRLLTFAFSGRDTQQSWTDALDHYLSFRSKLKHENRPTEAADKILRNFPERKEQWLAICTSWEKLNSRQLTDKQISDWYFLQAIEKKDKLSR